MDPVVAGLIIGCGASLELGVGLNRACKVIKEWDLQGRGCGYNYTYSKDALHCRVEYFSLGTRTSSPPSSSLDFYAGCNSCSLSIKKSEKSYEACQANQSTVQPNPESVRHKAIEDVEQIIID